MNLVELILKLLTGDSLGKLAGLVGENPDDTKKAIQAAVPTLLGGISGLAAKPEGANKLWSTLKQMDNDDLLRDLGGSLNEQRSKDLSKSGTSILEGLFGKGMVAALIGVLASFLGGKSGMVSKLLPLLVPVIMSMLKKQVSSGGLDLAGLTKVLLGQKNNIASAMPAGLAGRLAGAQGLGEFGGFAQELSRAASAAPRAAAQAASPARWLVPVLLLAAVLAGGYWWLNRAPAPEAPLAVPTISVTPGTESAQDAIATAQQLATQYGDLFTGLGTALGSVTDAASAQEALPSLELANRNLDGFAPLLDKLPAAARTQVTQSLETSTNSLQIQIDRVLAIPGVREILQPIMDTIMSKLRVLLQG